MRTINVVFEDKEYEQLKKLKADMSWHDFMIDLAEGRKNQVDVEG